MSFTNFMSKIHLKVFCERFSELTENFYFFIHLQKYLKEEYARASPNNLANNQDDLANKQTESLEI